MPFRTVYRQFSNYVKWWRKLETHSVALNPDGEGRQTRVNSICVSRTSDAPTNETDLAFAVTTGHHQRAAAITLQINTNW